MVPEAVADEVRAHGLAIAETASREAEARLRQIEANKLERQELVQKRSAILRLAPQAYRRYRQLLRSGVSRSMALSAIGAELELPVTLTVTLIRLRKKAVHDYIVRRRTQTIIRLKLRKRSYPFIAGYCGVTTQTVRRTLRTFEQQFSSQTTQLNGEIIRLRFKKLKQADIAQKLGCSKQTVIRAQKAARWFARVKT